MTRMELFRRGWDFRRLNVIDYHQKVITDPPHAGGFVPATEAIAATEEKEVVGASGSTRSKQKVQYGLVPAIAHRILAERMTLGVANHGAHNWELGQPWDVIIGHLEAHLNAMKERLWRGEKFDPVKHDDDAAAIMWACMAIAYFERDPSATPDAQSVFWRGKEPK